MNASPSLGSYYLFAMNCCALVCISRLLQAYEIRHRVPGGPGFLPYSLTVSFSLFVAVSTRSESPSLPLTAGRASPESKLSYIPLHSFLYNAIGAEGAVAIGETLKHNNTLTVLLWVTALHSRPLLLMPVPVYSNSLFTLLHRLGSNEIDFDGAAAIGDALRHNTTLTELQ
jgi:hypothetical protein